jgi:hypothetical protein
MFLGPGIQESFYEAHQEFVLEPRAQPPLMPPGEYALDAMTQFRQRHQAQKPVVFVAVDGGRGRRGAPTSAAPLRARSIRREAVAGHEPSRGGFPRSCGLSPSRP